MISEKEVQKIAKLSNLKLSEGEVLKFGKDLNKILEYAETLKEVDTEGVKPLYQVNNLKNIFREDEVKECDFSSKCLKLAPNSDENGNILVKNVL